MSMNYDLSEEHRIFWDAIASFVDKEIAPLVDKDNPGFHVTRKLEKAGLRSADTAEILFEDCRVPASKLLGGEEGGFVQVVKTLVGGRISYGGRCAGIAPGRLLRLNSSVVRRHRTSSTRPFSSSADTAS